MSFYGGNNVLWVTAELTTELSVTSKWSSTAKSCWFVQWLWWNSIIRSAWKICSHMQMRYFSLDQRSGRIGGLSDIAIYTAMPPAWLRNHSHNHNLLLCLFSHVYTNWLWPLALTFTLFSGWSRLTWMPASHSLPCHYVSVYWLRLRDLILHDR